MPDNVHIRRINDIWVNVLAGLDDGQTALLTDQGNEHVHRIGTNYFFETPSQHWTGAAWVYHDVIFKDIFSTNDIFVTRYIAHYGDSDTRRYFQNDRITDTVGGIDFVDMVEVAGQNYIDFNPGEEDVDFIVNPFGASNLLFGDAGKKRLGIGTNETTGHLTIVDYGITYSSGGIRLNVGISTAGTGTFIRDTAEAVRIVSDCGTLTDEGILTILDEGGSDGSILAGYGWIQCGGSLGAVLRFHDNQIFLINNDADVVTSDTDGKLCILAATAPIGGNSTIIQIKNRIGATLSIAYHIVYSKVAEQA